MGCGAWKPCFIAAGEGDEEEEMEEGGDIALDVTTIFQNILLIQGKISH